MIALANRPVIRTLTQDAASLSVMTREAVLACTIDGKESLQKIRHDRLFPLLASLASILRRLIRRFAVSPPRIP